MKTIILLSGKAGSGKDTAFSYFKEYFGSRCERFAFADELKEIAKEYFKWNGIKDEEGRELLIVIGQILRDDIIYENGYFKFGDKKRSLHNRIYKGFSLIDIFFKIHKSYTPFKDFLTTFIYHQITISNSEYAIITDFRFKNETKLFINNSEFKVKTVRIERNEAKIINDPSENDLDNFNFDYVVLNNSTIDNFKESVYNICEKVENA
jgi:hypothetical protein